MTTSFLFHVFGLPGYDYVRQECVGRNVLLHVRPKGKLVRCLRLDCTLIGFDFTAAELNIETGVCLVEERNEVGAKFTIMHTMARK